MSNAFWSDNAVWDTHGCSHALVVLFVGVLKLADLPVGVNVIGAHQFWKLPCGNLTAAKASPSNAQGIIAGILPGPVVAHVSVIHKVSGFEMLKPQVVGSLQV